MPPKDAPPTKHGWPGSAKWANRAAYPRRDSPGSGSIQGCTRIVGNRASWGAKSRSSAAMPDSMMMGISCDTLAPRLGWSAWVSHWQRTACLRSLRNSTHHAARIPHCQHARGNIPGHHTTCANHGTVANGDTGADDRSATDPHVRANHHGLAEFAGLAQFGIEGMCRGVDLHGRANQCASANAHFADVQHHTIEVEVDAFAEMNLGAVVAIEWRLKPDRIATGAEKCDKEQSAGCFVRLVCGVQFPEQITSTSASYHQFRVKRVIQFAREHFLTLGAHHSPVPHLFARELPQRVLHLSE